MRISDWSSDVCSSDLGAVYFESKGETLAGQLAVARVVINRSQSGDFPDSICGVVYQPSQFSFIRDGRMPSIKTGSRAWHRAIAIAQIALNDSWDSSAERSEEHTSELQSLMRISYAVFCLKKKNNTQ